MECGKVKRLCFPSKIFCGRAFSIVGTIRDCRGPQPSINLVGHDLDSMRQVDALGHTPTSSYPFRAAISASAQVIPILNKSLFTVQCAPPVCSCMGELDLS